MYVYLQYFASECHLGSKKTKKKNQKRKEKENWMNSFKHLHVIYIVLKESA